MFEHKTLFIDLETTGLVPRTRVPGKRPGTTKQEQIPYETMFEDYPHIVSMAWKIDDNPTNYYEFNQEGREVPKEASDIHGLTAEMLSKSPWTFNHGILAMIHDEVNCLDSEIVVGHNIYYDTSIIKANILREVDLNRPKFSLDPEHYEDIEEILHKWKRIDTVRSTAKMMGGWAALIDLHKKIFQTGFENHNAENDVEALYRCYVWLKRKDIVPTWEKLQEKAKEKQAKEEQKEVDLFSK